MIRNRGARNRLILELCLLAWALVVLVPFYMILVNAFKDTGEAGRFGLGLPSEWKWDNFSVVFQKGKILRGYMNSALIAGCTLVLASLSAALASFSIQRNNRRFTNFIYYLFVLGLVIPVALIPTIKLMMSLHIHNTYPGMVMYYSAVLLPFSVFLLTGFLKTVTRELDDSAIIDGCGPIRMFAIVILPLLKPVMVTACLFIVMSVWNDFMGPFYLLSDSSKWTVTVSVFSYVNQFGTHWNLVFADILIVITPVLVFYFFLQEHIVEGMTAGAVKG
jgi:raffinose/stachyose/melibiose transport system permease protein